MTRFCDICGSAKGVRLVRSGEYSCRKCRQRFVEKTLVYVKHGSLDVLFV